MWYATSQIQSAKLGRAVISSATDAKEVRRRKRADTFSVEAISRHVWVCGSRREHFDVTISGPIANDGRSPQHCRKEAYYTPFFGGGIKWIGC